MSVGLSASKQLSDTTRFELDVVRNFPLHFVSLAAQASDVLE
jgi:hypothetical protein